MIFFREAKELVKGIAMMPDETSQLKCYGFSE